MPRPSVRAGLVVGLSVLGFWFAVLIGGLLNPGYQQTRDYVSALA